MLKTGLLRRILSRFHVYILWTLLCVFLWGGIFTMLTDTKPDRKLSLYVSASDIDETELAAKMEEGVLPDGIRMVKVHPFSYALFDSNDIMTADLYVVKDSEVQQYRDSFGVLPEGLTGDIDLGSGIEGILVYDCVSGKGVYDTLIRYSSENYYLFFGAGSLHTAETDGGAEWLARRFLSGDAEELKQ